MKDPDKMAAWPPSLDGDLHGNLADYDLSGQEDPTTVTGRLVSLEFLAAALRRRSRLWLALAGVGLLLGLGYFAGVPHSYKATVSILLADEPESNPAVQVQTDMVLAQSLPVAEGAIRQLKLSQAPEDFLKSFSATEMTPEVIQMTVSAPTSNQAVRTASVVANQFLKFRAQYEQTQEQQTDRELKQQVTQAHQHLSSIGNQISTESRNTSDPNQQSLLKGLRSQQTDASNNLSQVQDYATQTKATTATVTKQVIQGSRVLDAATAVKRSRMLTLALYVFGGLFGGLVLGVAIVIIGAITSDRLLRRNDIAYAIGAPVRLSVNSLRKNRWFPGLPGQFTARRLGMDRVITHLGRAAAAGLSTAERQFHPDGSHLPGSLAVVAVDDARPVAEAVAAVAISNAGQRHRVVLADLSDGGHAARLLGAARPGITTIRPDDVEIVVIMPGPEDVAPVGPLPSRAGRQAPLGPEIAAACAGADLVLSLVTLDPAAGADHLSTWATEAVATVTAGQATSTRIRAVGDMVRLSGTRLDSVVVIGADRRDESLGRSDGASDGLPAYSFSPAARWT